jgi:DNA adenine methylase
MAYVGGKATGASHILRVLNDPAFDGMDYVEPFVGYAHVLRRVERKRSYVASDANPLLVRLLNAVQRGTPLPRISEGEYERLRRSGGATLRHAVAAFTYSYNGKEWGGYTTTDAAGTRDYPAERLRYYERLRANAVFRRTTLRCAPYEELRPRGALIYCDPPYRGTTGYGGRPFDHAAFWATVKRSM